MTDPVITTNGQTYERAYIQEWFRHHATDPLTNTVIRRVLIPNRALKRAIESFNLQLSAISTTQQSTKDREMAVQLWVQEMQAALTRKGAIQNTQESARQVQESVPQLTLNTFSDRFTDSESNILNSIPEDLVRRIADLEGGREAAKRAELVTLRDKRGIVESSELLEYYVAVQSNLSGILLTCGVISSMIEMSEENVTAAITFVEQQFPVASIALSFVSTLLKAYDDSTQRKRLYRVARIFNNDTVLMALVTEMVAREMAKFHKDRLVMAAGSSAKTSSATISERMNNTLKRCRAPAVKNASKLIAQKHCEGVFTAIMDGVIDVPYGDSVVIFEAIFNHITEI